MNLCNKYIMNLLYNTNIMEQTFTNIYERCFTTLDFR